MQEKAPGPKYLTVLAVSECCFSLCSVSDWPSVTDAAEGFIRVAHWQVCGPAPLPQLAPAAAARGEHAEPQSR